MRAAALRDRLASRARKQGFERELRAAGIVAGPRRLATGPARLDGVAAIRRLAALLPGRGIVPAAFGRYLSARADLLPAEACLALAAIPDLAPPLSPEALEEALERGFGVAAGSVLESLDAEPAVSRLLVEVHRGRLLDGRPVLLRVRRPLDPVAVEEELALLPAVGRAPFLVDADVATLVADFRADLALRLDAAQESAALAALAAARPAGLGERGAFAVARPVPEASGPGIVTVEDPGGEPLATVPAADPEAGAERARRIALGWLRAALVGPFVPLELELWRSDRSPGERRPPALVGGAFVATRGGDPAAWWQVLRATAAAESDAVYGALRDELAAAPGAAGPPDERELRRSLRQAVPFRDGAWSDDGEDLVEHLMLALAAVRRSGFRPLPGLAAFGRGIVATAAALRPGLPATGPGSDPFAGALAELEWRAGWAQLRWLASPAEVRSALESGAFAFAELPRKVDRVLDLLAEREPALDKARPERRAAGPGVTVATVAAIAAVGGLAPQLVAAGLDPTLVNGVGGALVLALAVALLRGTGGKPTDSS